MGSHKPGKKNRTKLQNHETGGFLKYIVSVKERCYGEYTGL